MMDQQQKILITGSAGFIGFHTAQRLLEQNYTVVGIDNFNNYYDPKLKHARNDILLQNNNYHFYEADITDGQEIKKIFETEKPNKALHLAAQAGVRYSIENPLVYADANIKGSVVIMMQSIASGVEHIVAASSSSVYGNNPIPWSESQPVNEPLNPYGASKRALELFAYSFHHLYKTPITLLRFFTVYGPWGRPDMAYFKFADKISAGETIDVYNHGKMRRDFTYIDDIVAGILAALEKPNNYSIYNLGNSKSEELEEFISIIEHELGKKADKNYLPMQPGEFVENFADIDKAKKELGFEPKTDVKTGLHTFAEWYKEYHSSKLL